MSGINRKSDRIKVSKTSFLHALDQIRKRNLDFVSLEAFKIRTLVHSILPALNLKLEDVYALKDKCYIHPQCSVAIYNLLYSLKLSPLDKILIQSLMSNDYHDLEIMREFGKMLTRLAENCPKKNELDKIFAIDGLAGDMMKYENYIHNLKYPLKVDNGANDFVMTHIQAVRHLYDDKTVTPIQVYRALEAAFWNKNNDEDIMIDDNNLGEVYKKLLGSQKDLIISKFQNKISK